ncbi:competence protein ComEC [Ereboglobus sp. PH5-10]|uniref:ComEC/Rec2 family competence protein n=1 Tax=Ereboglobus sp. PH5-10 TaxID=2940629 RepID=UPI002405BC5F|nr:ComEC/Rec2 family competence protein [Ereboglobus sp. PH5-10]MDF9826261.1 competence protein ComEC [Ereboglobus sp. PH5-10]
MSQPQDDTPAPTPQTTPKLRSLRHRAPLLWILIPFMAGLAAAKTAPHALPAGWLLGGALVLALASIALAPRHWSGLVALVLCVLLSGAASYEINRSRLASYDALPPREARLTLRVTHTFAQGVRGARGKSDAPRISGLARVTDAAPHLRELVGQRVYYSLALPVETGGGEKENTPPPIIRSAEITATGVLYSLPRRVAADSFDGYLASSGMNFKFSRGRLLGVEKPPDATAAFYERMRQRFSKILSAGLEHRPQQAGVLRAMVLGQKQDIEEQQHALFLGSGTMHLFAISGLHIAVIATGIQFLLLFLRLPVWPRVIAGTLALYVYVQITGASPSATRAFTMVALLQASLLLRLPANAIATLAFAALATLLVAPMQLFSASFQMSYSIVAALLLFGLPLGETWLARWVPFRDTPQVARNWFQKKTVVAHRAIVSALGISIAASLVSAICSTIYFKLFTPGALLANLVLIPAASLVILSGFISLFFGLIGITPLSVLFNHASALLLFTMEKSLELFLEIPVVAMPAHFSPQWTGYCALALLLASLLCGYSQKWTRRLGGFWMPVVIVAAALLFFAHRG